MMDQVLHSAVGIYNTLAPSYPAEFPPSLFIQAGQRLVLPSGEAGEPLRQEVVAVVLSHLVREPIREQIHNEDDRAATIELALVVFQRYGACPLGY
jgi:hypothetical protein